jgi:hypothetical protein
MENIGISFRACDYMWRVYTENTASIFTVLRKMQKQAASLMKCIQNQDCLNLRVAWKNLLKISLWKFAFYVSTLSGNKNSKIGFCNDISI